MPDESNPADCPLPQGNLILRTAGEDGKLTNETFDMVVLSVGFEPHKDAEAFAKTFGIEMNGAFQGGINRSRDRGESWHCIGNNFPPVHSVRFA